MITIKGEYDIETSVNSFDELLEFIDYDFISEINCSNNNLTFLPKLPVYLVTLYCSNNNLSLLPKLPPFLECLECSNNKLTSLPALPKTLMRLYTADNTLSELPVIPLKLRILHCSNNKLSKLPHIPGKVSTLNCINNNITDLPDMPENIYYLLYINNPISDFIYTYFKGHHRLYFDWKDSYKKKYVSKLSDWFLECKYNPKYKYCRDRINAEYNELINCQLSSQ
jgi:hypothetical protein